MEPLILDKEFYFQGHGLYPRLKSLGRCKRYRRWSIAPANDSAIKNRIYIYDSDHGSAFKSYMTAVKILKKNRELVRAGLLVVSVERSTKGLKLGIPGIWLKPRYGAGGQVVSLSFQIGDPVEKRQPTFLIGPRTGDSLVERWNSAFQKALEKRNQVLDSKHKLFNLTEEEIQKFYD